MPAERVERRLAAILSADMVGYSRLMGADEAGTIARQKAHREELMAPTITAHNGRIVKTIGDGLLVEFGSAVDAVECAIATQQAMAEREADVSTESRIQYRIGVNLGDIVIDGDDILGDGVNVAARLEALAEAGGICVSGTVMEHIAGKLDIAFVDAGEHELKNINRPVHVWRWAPGGVDQLPESFGPVSGFQERPAVAVLPFDNLSRDEDQEYFADGLTEDIITGLSLWRSFPVIARNSTFAYKGQSPDVRKVATDLAARYVVEGSIRRAGEQIRVNVQLIDAATGTHLWADKFDRGMSDIFALQDEITERIVASIEPELHRAEERRAALKRPRDLTAWDHILRASRAKAIGAGYGTTEGNEEAKQHLSKAIALDPTSAEALALLSQCEWHDAINGWVDDPTAALERATEAATDAVNSDDANWLAHAILGLALLFGRHEADAAVEEAGHAVRFNPSAALGCHIYGCTLEFAGQPAEAIPHLEAVFRLDPRYRSRAAVLADLALCNLLLDRPEKAAEYGHKAVAAEPNYVRARQRLVAALAAAGRIDEARAALAEVIDLQPGFSLGYVRDTYPFKNPADLEILLDGLRKAGLSA